MSFLPRTSRFRLFSPALVLLVIASARAQQPAVATVAFTCNFPASSPSQYGFSVTSDGQAVYTSDAKLNRAENADATSAGDSPFHMAFALSPATTGRILKLAKAAHYFEGNIDSRKKNIAFTGDKTLTYHDADGTHAATFNYSPLPAVQELISIFQNLSAAVEFGRRMDYEYRYQKLALDEEMRNMDNTTVLHDVGPDLPAAVPVLQKIADDHSVINPVRARAMRLLQQAAAGK